LVKESYILDELIVTKIFQGLLGLEEIATTKENPQWWKGRQGK
jgi:hypothetical protein